MASDFSWKKKKFTPTSPKKYIMTFPSGCTIIFYTTQSLITMPLSFKNELRSGFPEGRAQALFVTDFLAPVPRGTQQSPNDPELYRQRRSLELLTNSRIYVSTMENILLF